MPWQLQALARALLRAPLHLQRNFSSSGSDDNASTSKARPGLRRSAKGNTSAPKEVHHAIDFRGGGGIGVLSASPRTVRRFAVCEDLPSDSPAGAAQQQSFWWSSDPAMYILGIDCSVRSTGYCVLKARAAPAGPLQQNQVPVISSAASSANAGANDGTAAHCVAACGSISTSTGMASSIDPARFLTEVRACLAQVKGDVEKEFGAGKWLVVVEDCLIQYQGRRSSADTIVNLARFNALISAAASLEFNGAIVRVNPRVAKAAFGLLVNSRPKQKLSPRETLVEQQPREIVEAPAKARATPRALLQKRATMQLLLPLLLESGYADSGSSKTMSDVADAALLALWLQRARASAVASADHERFSAAYPAAAAEISAPQLHTAIGQLGWRPAAAKDVAAIIPGAGRAACLQLLKWRRQCGVGAKDEALEVEV